MILGNQGDQVLLDFDRIALFGEPKAQAQAGHVGVDDDSDVDVEGVAQDHVGGLAADSGQGGELVHRLWDLAGVVIEKGLGHGADGFALAAKEARGVDIALQLGRIGRGIILGGAILLEEIFGHDIDTKIGALGREDRGDQQLQSVAMIEAAFGVGIRALQDGENRGDAVLAH